tara:strand:+ start:279 stop:887 length:609 start_codon:yes stop_codon:yes gene_type:complete
MEQKKEIRVFNADYEVRLLEGENGDVQVSGYAALFDHESRDLGFFETIDTRAFEGRLDDNVILTFNHDGNLILDRNQGGTLKLSVDERGLKYDATLPDTTTGRDVAELMRRGLLYESSFAFTVEDDEWSQEDGKTKRTINKIGRLYDVSIVGVGAYANTDVALRSMEEFEKNIEIEMKSNEKEKDLHQINLLKNELTLKSKI